MKTIKFAAYLFYRYYRKPPQRGIPYFRTIVSLTFFCIMNVLFVACLFGEGNFISKAADYFSLDKRIIILVLMFLPGTIFLFLIKEKDLNELDLLYEKNIAKIKKGNVSLIFYCIISFALVFIGTLWNKYINS